MIVLESISTSRAVESYPRDAVIDVPGGFGRWVFMLFTTDYEILTPEGIVNGNRGELVINSPAYPQWHRGRGSGYHNYYFHFRNAGPSLCKRYGIAENRPVKIFSSLKCYSLMKDLEREFLIKEPYWEEEAEGLIHSIHREAGRQVSLSAGEDLTPAEKTHWESFKELKQQLYNEYRKAWSLGDMAVCVNLSESRLLDLYKRFFKTSPVDDLIMARVHRARILLESSSMTLNQIAGECGFSSPYYFSRIFKKKTGLPPGRYRESRRDRFP